MAKTRLGVGLALPVVLLLLSRILCGLWDPLVKGCTSVHGVCGLARLSPRSLAATATFMAYAFLTVFVGRHLL